MLVVAIVAVGSVSAADEIVTDIDEPADDIVLEDVAADGADEQEETMNLNSVDNDEKLDEGISDVTLGSNEVIINSDFSDGLNNWTTYGTVDVSSDDVVGDYVVLTGKSYISQEINGSSIGKISFYYKNNASTTPTFTVTMGDMSNGGLDIFTKKISETDWTLVEYDNFQYDGVGTFKINCGTKNSIVCVSGITYVLSSDEETDDTEFTGLIKNPELENKAKGWNITGKIESYDEGHNGSCILLKYGTGISQEVNWTSIDKIGFWYKNYDTDYNDAFLSVKIGNTEIFYNNRIGAKNWTYWEYDTSDLDVCAVLSFEFTSGANSPIYIDSINYLLHSSVSVNVVNITYGSGFTIEANLSDNISDNVVVVINNNEYVVEVINGSGVLDVDTILNAGTYDVLANYNGNSIYAGSNASSNFNVAKLSTNMSVNVANITYGSGFTVNVNLSDNISDIVTVIINNNNYTVEVINGSGVLNVGTILNAGSYSVLSVYNTVSNYVAPNASSNFTVSPIVTKITAFDISMVYNTAKSIVVTATNVSDGSVIILKINGKSYNGAVKNGKATISLPATLIPKTYTAFITFAGDNNHKASATNVSVKISKAKPKLTAKAKTFKVKTKTKKVTATLKNNKGKVLKNNKVTLKIKGKTYKAKTNKKGVATFKVTKLNKKGTFKGKVKFAGNKYFKAISKTVKIKVKK